MAVQLHIDDLNAGDVAIVGFQRKGGAAHRFSAKFIGWFIESNRPRARFENMDGSSWDAYLFEGRFCVGSSADPLIVWGAP